MQIPTTFPFKLEIGSICAHFLDSDSTDLKTFISNHVDSIIGLHRRYKNINGFMRISEESFLDIKVENTSIGDLIVSKIKEILNDPKVVSIPTAITGLDSKGKIIATRSSSIVEYSNSIKADLEVLKYQL